MIRWFFAAVLCFSFFAHAQPDEVSVIAQAFQEHLSGGEATALERTFFELRSAKLVDESQWAAVAPVFTALQAGLNDLTPAGARASALRFVLLTNYLEVIRLKGECRAYACGEALQASDGHYRRAFSSLGTAGIVEADREALVREEMKSAEGDYTRAQSQLVRSKTLESVHDLTIRVRALSEIERTGGGYDRSFDLLRQAHERYRAGDDTTGSQLVSKALQSLFDPALATRFDNRHLLHLVQLRLVVAYLGNSPHLNEGEKGALRAGYEAVLATNDAAAYQQAADQVQSLVMGLVKDKNLTQLDPWLAVKLSPAAVQRNAAARLNSLAGAFAQVRERFNKEQSFLQGLNRWKNNATLAALEDVRKALDKAATRVGETTSPGLIFNAYRDAGTIELVTRYFLEAALNRSKTVYGYEKLLVEQLNVLSGTRRFSDDSAMHQIFELLRQERRENVLRAYVNRETVTLAAVSVALVAEAVSIPFTGGGSATAMPATLQAITSASIATSKVVLITSSALNIADRTKANGWHGLLNVDTAFDALVILSLSPRYTPGAAPATTAVGRWGQGTLTAIAQLQYSSSSVLAGLGTVYGGYLVYSADRIASDLNKEGVNVTAAEVRRRGMVNIALGLLAATENYRYRQAGHESHGARFDKAIEPGTWKGSLEKFKNLLRPYGAARDAYRLHPGLFGMVKSVGIGLMYASEDFILVNEAILLSYTNLDGRYMNQIEARHPFPEMKEGETAVILVGFDEEDPLLYNGAHAQHSNRRELQKYGKNVYVYDFTGPDDMVAVLKKHAREHGKIRYLKIATHGRPGMLYTRTVAAAPEEDGNASGWINTPWLKHNKSALQAMSREVFAGDARIVLWACLVGSNVEDNRTGEITPKGDEFLHEFGDALLVGGGAIDSSTRILLGLEATLGSFAHAAFKNSFAPDEAQHLDLKLGAQKYPAVPFFPILLETGTAPAITASESSSNRLIDSAKYMGNRFAKMVIQMPQLWWQYGVSLEGPWWASRYKYLDVPAH